MNHTTEKLMALATDFANSAGVIDSAQKQQALRLAIDAALSAPAWPIRGVRVEDDKVIVTVKGGNDAARQLCGELVALIDGQQARAALSAPPQWIPVSERLPEKNIEVLICFAGQSTLAATGQYTASEHDIGGWCYPAENRDLRDEGKDPLVTHWMPLPDPPAAPSPQEQTP